MLVPSHRIFIESLTDFLLRLYGSVTIAQDPTTRDFEVELNSHKSSYFLNCSTALKLFSNVLIIVFYKVHVIYLVNLFLFFNSGATFSFSSKNSLIKFLCWWNTLLATFRNQNCRSYGTTNIILLDMILFISISVYYSQFAKNGIILNRKMCGT